MSNSRTYYYARVSSSEQNLGRQLDAFEKLGATSRDIVTDKQSGKNLDRQGYNALKITMLRRGDTLVIKSLDRLSRIKADISHELQFFRDNGIHLKIIDLPTSMADFPEGHELMAETIQNIIIELYSMMAEQERNNIRQRQWEGYNALERDSKGRLLSKNGNPVGRRAVQRPTNWKAVTKRWRAGEITANAAMQELGLKRNSFYKLAKEDNAL